MIDLNSGTTFQVSNVERSKELLPASDYANALSDLLGKKLEACSKGDKLFSVRELNLFLTAVSQAFNQHYPLLLSPDAIWLCLIQGFALHVNAYAEQLRHHFVQHKGKEIITIRRDDFVKGSPDNPWPEVFGEFSVAIKNYIGDKHELIVSEFSTTTPTERAVSEIVLMDTFHPYFDYWCVTLCGIPEITLTGTVEDWKSIRQRAEKFAEFDLAWWVNALLPILDQFVAAASGNVEQKFWQSFYKWDNPHISGHPYVTGWVNVLFPYIKDRKTEAYTRRNPSVNSWSKAMKDRSGVPQMDSFPVGLSKVPFKWDYLDLTFDMEFVGGFVGVVQDQKTFTLRPEIGWAVLEENQSNN